MDETTLDDPAMRTIAVGIEDKEDPCEAIPLIDKDNADKPGAVEHDTDRKYSILDVVRIIAVGIEDKEDPCEAIPPIDKDNADKPGAVEHDTDHSLSPDALAKMDQATKDDPKHTTSSISGAVEHDSDILGDDHSLSPKEIYMQLSKALLGEVNEEGKFKTTLEALEAKNYRIDLNVDIEGRTFLQMSCDMGHHKIVDLLLNKGANPNLVGTFNNSLPIVLAANHGFYKVIRVLKKFDGIPVDFSASVNIFHKILKAEESGAIINQHLRNYNESLNLLLPDDNPSYRNTIAVAINFQDNLGNTPLHVAAQNDNHEGIRKLLMFGANFGIKNYKGETPMHHISPTIIKDFLDECVVGEGLTTNDDFKVTLNYPFGSPAPIGHNSNDTKQNDCYVGLQTQNQELIIQNQEIATQHSEALIPFLISQSADHRHLLKHPIINSYLYLKWRTLLQFILVNFVFDLIHFSLLLYYILDGNKKRGYDILTIFIIVFHSLFTARELIQMFVSSRRYIHQLEKILKVILIVLTSILLFWKYDDLGTKYIYAVIILLLFIELFLFLGKFLPLSIYIKMIGTVGINYLKCILLYGIIFLPFGLIFSVILHPQKDGENPYFTTIPKSLMKTFVMGLIGELDFENIKFYSPVDMVFIGIFFLFIPLVINFMIAVAVSDINEIHKDSEISDLASRAEDIFDLDSRLGNSSLSFDQSLSAWKINCLRNIFFVFGKEIFPLFGKKLDNKKAVFYPNRSCVEMKNKDLKLSEDILRATKELVIKKRSRDREAGCVIKSHILSYMSATWEMLCSYIIEKYL